MRFTPTKKISELEALSPATLDTTFVVGISGSTTYKISINQLTSSLDTTFATDLVTSALSNSLNSKLSTSSYSTDSASFNSRIISGSAVAGTISGSSQISALGFVTGSYTTINSFNSLTQSFNSISQSFTTISGSFGSIDFSGINNVTTSYLAFTQSYYSASASFDSRITTVSASVSIGTSGTSGINGTSGAQGNQGPTGPQGNQGPQGINGTAGSSGTSGTNGSQGPQGTQGAQGPQGINGTAGSSGAQGNQGANGSNGSNGAQGNQGPQGNQGATGSGTQGAQGPTGGTGPQGTQGTQGNQGPQGVQGSIGTSGTSGVSMDSGSFATTSSVTTISASAWGAFQSASSYSSSVSTSLSLVSASLQSSISASNYNITINSASVSSLSSSFNTRVNANSASAWGAFQTASANSSSLATSITSVSGTFTNLTVNGQPTTYGVVNPDFINAGRITSDQTGMGVNSDIIFNAWVYKNGVSLDTTTGVFTLTANKTYRLFSELSFSNFSSVVGYMIYNWVDATTNTRLDTSGISAGIGEAINRDTNEFNATSTTLIYTPTTNQTIKVRITEAVGTATVRSAIGTKAIIEQINPTIAVQSTTTGTVAATIVTDTNVVGTTINGGSNTSPALTILTLAIPSAGTWRLDSELRVYVPGAGYMAAAFYDNGTLIPNSEYFVAAGGVTQSGAATGQYSGFMSYDLTTTGARTVTVGIWSTTSANAIDSGDGRTWARATKIDSTFALNALDTMQISNSLAVTGSTTLRGAVNVGTGSALEGGEIDMAYAQTTTLTGSAVVFDVYADKIRIFENGGNSRGAYLDLTKQAAGVGSEILTKASGMVNAGTDVTLGNLKVRMSTSGNRSLQVSTVTGTYSVYGSGVYSYNGVGGSTIDASSPRAISTTPAYIAPSYTFTTAGATDTWILMDTTVGIAWRITMIVGSGYNNNIITIERLY